MLRNFSDKESDIIDFKSSYNENTKFHIEKSYISTVLYKLTITQCVPAAVA